MINVANERSYYRATASGAKVTRLTHYRVTVTVCFHASLFGSQGVAASEIARGKRKERRKELRKTLQVVLNMLETERPQLKEDQLLRPIATVHALYEPLSRDGERVAIGPMVEDLLG